MQYLSISANFLFALFVYICRVFTHHYLFICAPPQSLLKAFGLVPQTLVLKGESIHLILRKCTHKNTRLHTVPVQTSMFKPKKRSFFSVSYLQRKSKLLKVLL